MGGLSFPAFPSVPSMAEETQTFVNDTLTEARAAAQSFTSTAMATVAELRNAPSPSLLPDPPEPPPITASFDSSIGGSGSGDLNLGQVNIETPPPLTLPDAGVDPSGVPEVPEYHPVVTGVSLPGDVTPGSFVIPAPPVIDTVVTVPNAPVANYGEIPELIPLSLPTFVAPAIDTFDAEVPLFSAATPTGLVSWTEPEYEAWIADQLKTVLQQMLAGGTGISPVVEAAIWDRDRARLDVAARSATEAARDDFAAAGFSLPGFSVISKIQAVRRENAEKVAQASRDIAIKQADLEQSNRQFAVKTGAELENMFIQVFLQTTQRTFDIAKLEVESQIQVFNATVQAYDVQQKIFAVRVDKWKAGLQYAQAQIEIYRARLEAERVKSGVNKDLIDAYKSKVDAFQSQVEAYRAVVQAATARAEMQKIKADLYRAEIEGVRAKIDAKKSEYDGFVARVQGETAKVGLEEANARSYAARVGAISSVAEVAVKDAEIKLSKSKLMLEAHVAALQRTTTLAQVQLSQVQANGQAYEAMLRRDMSEFEAERAATESEAQTEIEANRTRVAWYAANIEAWKTKAQQVIEYARINQASIQAAGQISATLAAGAMAGTSVSASFGGNVSRSENTSQSETYSESKSESESTSTSVSTNTNYNHNMDS